MQSLVFPRFLDVTTAYTLAQRTGFHIFSTSVVEMSWNPRSRITPQNGQNFKNFAWPVGWGFPARRELDIDLRVLVFVRHVENYKKFFGQMLGVLNVFSNLREVHLVVPVSRFRGYHFETKYRSLDALRSMSPMNQYGTVGDFQGAYYTNLFRDHSQTLRLFLSWMGFELPSDRVTMCEFAFGWWAWQFENCLATWARNQ